MMEIKSKTLRASVKNRKEANEFSWASKEILQGKMLGITLLKMMISLNIYLNTEGRNCELLIGAPKIPGASLTKHFH